MTDATTLSIGDLCRGIAAGRIDPVDLTEAYLEAIAKHPRAGDIYARTTPDRARAEAGAAAARAKAGTLRSAVDGIPLSWKDLFDSAGTATEAGSRLLAGRTPDADAAVLEAATFRGAVCLGKTHLSELAFSGLGFNPMTATPPNINDSDRLPGGSSSGAAASVAHGLAAGAIGSDTAGSVRIPAAWNDLVGLKTTHGALPDRGIVPLCPRLDTAGPLTRTVEDAGLLFEAMGGPDAPDLRGATLEGRRFLVLEGVVREDVDAAVDAAVEAAIDRLARAGAVIERARIPAADEVLGLSGLFGAEAYGVWGEAIEANPGVMYDRIVTRFRTGADMSAAEFVRGWRRIDALREAYAAATAAHDAVLLPTCPILPPKTAEVAADEDYYTTANILSLRNTRVGSLLGLCGLSLPTGTPSVGLLFQGGPGTEARLLRLGAAAEKVLT